MKNKYTKLLGVLTAVIVIFNICIVPCYSIEKGQHMGYAERYGCAQDRQSESICRCR